MGCEGVLAILSVLAGIQRPERTEETGRPERTLENRRRAEHLAICLAYDVYNGDVDKTVSETGFSRERIEEVWDLKEKELIHYSGGYPCNLPRLLYLLEEMIVREALLETRGNQLQAAKLVGVTGGGFWNRVRKLGINVNDYKK